VRIWARASVKPLDALQVPYVVLPVPHDPSNCPEALFDHQASGVEPGALGSALATKLVANGH
jgi:hypothetical protein